MTLLSILIVKKLQLSMFSNVESLDASTIKNTFCLNFFLHDIHVTVMAYQSLSLTWFQKKKYCMTFLLLLFFSKSNIP